MSFTYSGNPAASSVDAARFLIGDTNPNAPIMQDEEIQYLLDTYGDGTNACKYQLFNRTATLFARDIKRSLGPQSEDPTDRLNYFRSQADYYKALMSTSGVSVPKYTYPKIFRKGMHNNPPCRGDANV